MDYLAPLHNELAYCLAVEKLLGITDDVPERAQAIRVILTELNRITSHQVVAGHRRHGARRAVRHDLRVPRARDDPGHPRVRHRPADEPRLHPPRRGRPGPARRLRRARPHRLDALPGKIDELEDLLTENPIWMERNKGVGVLTAEQCLDLGVTGPVLRAPGCPRPAQGPAVLRHRAVRLRRATTDTATPTAVPHPLAEMRSPQDRPAGAGPLPGGPVMVADKKIAWPAQLALGPDGLGNAKESTSARSWASRWRR
jgi:NADH-quinone oxidoreductase subunit D